MPQSLNYSPTFAERYPVAFIAALVDAGLGMLAFLLKTSASYSGSPHFPIG